MPIVRTFRLEGVQFVVTKERAVALKDGRPLFERGSPSPKMVEQTLIVFADPQSATQIVVPLDEDGRQELVRMLTGGIVVPANGDQGAQP